MGGSSFRSWGSLGAGSPSALGAPRGLRKPGAATALPVEARGHGGALGADRLEQEAAAESGAGVAVHQVDPSPIGDGVIEQGGETGGVCFADDQLEAPADQINHHVVLRVVAVEVARVPHQGLQPGAADGILLVMD